MKDAFSPLRGSGVLFARMQGVYRVHDCQPSQKASEVGEPSANMQMEAMMRHEGRREQGRREGVWGAGHIREQKKLGNMI